MWTPSHEPHSAAIVAQVSVPTLVCLFTGYSPGPLAGKSYLGTSLPTVLWAMPTNQV